MPEGSPVHVDAFVVDGVSQAGEQPSVDDVRNEKKSADGVGREYGLACSAI